MARRLSMGEDRFGYMADEIARDDENESLAEERPQSCRDGFTVSFLRGVTVRDILRTHQLLRKFHWDHLYDRRQPQ